MCAQHSARGATLDMYSSERRHVLLQQALQTAAAQIEPLRWRAAWLCWCH